MEEFVTKMTSTKNGAATSGTTGDASALADNVYRVIWLRNCLRRLQMECKERCEHRDENRREILVALFTEFAENIQGANSATRNGKKEKGLSKEGLLRMMVSIGIGYSNNSNNNNSSSLSSSSSTLIDPMTGQRCLSRRECNALFTISVDASGHSGTQYITYRIFSSSLMTVMMTDRLHSGQVYNAFVSQLNESAASRYRQSCRSAMPMSETVTISAFDRDQTKLSKKWRAVLWSEIADRLYRRHLTTEDLFHCLDSDQDGYVSVEDCRIMLSLSENQRTGASRTRRNGKISAKAIIAPTGSSSQHNRSSKATAMVAPLNTMDPNLIIRTREIFDLLNGKDYVDKIEFLSLLSLNSVDNEGIEEVVDDQKESETINKISDLDMHVVLPSTSIDEIVRVIQGK